MSNDLIQRLRFCAGPWSDPHLSTEAADEIERQAERIQWLELALQSEKNAFKTETERLTRELEDSELARKALLHAECGNCERLTRERDEWKKQASGGIDSEWDARMELEKLRAERDRLRDELDGPVTDLIQRLRAAHDALASKLAAYAASLERIANSDTESFLSTREYRWIELREIAREALAGSKV